ncbi:hypothetical protein GCM10009618_12100 [Nesterenkonia lacusekhoensis]
MDILTRLARVGVCDRRTIRRRGLVLPPLLCRAVLGAAVLCAAVLCPAVLCPAVLVGGLLRWVTLMPWVALLCLVRLLRSVGLRRAAAVGVTLERTVMCLWVRLAGLIGREARQRPVLFRRVVVLLSRLAMFLRRAVDCCGTAQTALLRLILPDPLRRLFAGQPPLLLRLVPRPLRLVLSLPGAVGVGPGRLDVLGIAGCVLVGFVAV